MLNRSMRCRVIDVTIDNCGFRLTATPLSLLGAGGFGCVYKIKFGGMDLTGKLVSILKFSNARSAASDKLVVSMAQGPFMVT